MQNIQKKFLMIACEVDRDVKLLFSSYYYSY